MPAPITLDVLTACPLCKGEHQKITRDGVNVYPCPEIKTPGMTAFFPLYEPLGIKLIGPGLWVTEKPVVVDELASLARQKSDLEQELNKHKDQQAQAAEVARLKAELDTLKGGGVPVTPPTPPEPAAAGRARARHDG